jgi:hypothetical protein
VPFIWSLTWYSYWILRDITVWHKSLNQIDPTNWAGAIISIAIILSGAHIGKSIRSAIAKIHIGKNSRSAFARALSRKTPVGTNTSEGVQITPISVETKTKSINQMEKPKRRMRRARIRTEKPEQPIGHSQEQFSSANICPHNLDYFSIRPRPKQVPEECIACRNLIQCVCPTDT